MAHSRGSSTGESTSKFGIPWFSFFPFSSSALASLPENTSRPARYTREDDIPEQDHTGVRNYNSIQSLPPNVRVPRKVSTAIKVEGKVWFSNERSVSHSPLPTTPFILFLAWLSWLNAAILIGALAAALFNASRDPIARAFAYVYAALSVGVVVRLSTSTHRILHLTTFEIYGFYLYQSRITMIRKRDPGHHGPFLSLLHRQ